VPTIHSSGGTQADPRGSCPQDLLAPPKATLRFDASGVDGEVTAGTTMRIAHDRARLVHQLWGGTPFGPNSIRIDAYVSFDGAAPVALPIDEDYGSLIQPLVPGSCRHQGHRAVVQGRSDVYVPSSPGPHVPREGAPRQLRLEIRRELLHFAVSR
jgi:hypothetical protein